MRSPNEKGFEVTTPRSPNPNTHSPDFNDLPEWLQPASTLAQMKAARRWLLHREKQPFYASGKPRSGTLDSPQDVAQLVSFTEADAALAANPKFSGLGFALGHGWQGIDLDHLDTNQHLHQLAHDLPGYVEKSPSGKGVHAIGFGGDFAAVKGRGAEAYAHGRYLTYTGDQLRDAPLTDMEGFVREVVAPIAGVTPREAVVYTSANTAPVTADIAEVASALAAVPPNVGYSEWVASGMAVHAATAGAAEGFELWDQWSAKCEAKYKASEMVAKWGSFTPAPGAVPVGPGSLFKLAREHGWQGHTPDVSGLFDAVPVVAPTAPVIDAAPEPQIVNLSDLDTSEPAAPEFRLSELIPCGEVTLLAAHGGTGKTALAQHMAVCLAMGLPCMGKTSKPSKVLFYSAEDGAAVMRWKFAKECRRMGVASAALAERLTLVDASEADPVLFHEVTQGGARSGKVTNEFNRLGNLMAKTGAEVLIVDNASDVYAADENNRPQVRAFLRSLRKLVAPLNGAVLLLVHVDKATAKAGGSEGYSGSTAWHNSVRSRLFLTTSTTVPDGLMLEQKKSNRGRCSDPIILKWSEGLPTFQGSYIETQTSDTDVLNSIVSMVHEYHKRGETLSTSATAHTNAFKVLSSDKSFPKIDKSRFWALLREAERMGLIHREVYQTAHRKTAERWRASFAPSAPS